jgi:pilus assembly protein Flp/PilA
MGGSRVIDLCVIARAIVRDRRGVTALEYGIIAGVLGLALITIFKTFGGKLSALFSGIGGSI